MQLLSWVSPSLWFFPTPSGAQRFSFLFLQLEGQTFTFPFLLHTSHDPVPPGLSSKRTEKNILGTTVSLTRDKGFSPSRFYMYLLAVMTTAADVGLAGGWDWTERKNKTNKKETKILTPALGFGQPLNQGRRWQRKEKGAAHCWSGGISGSRPFSQLACYHLLFRVLLWLLHQFCLGFLVILKGRDG